MTVWYSALKIMICPACLLYEWTISLMLQCEVYSYELHMQLRICFYTLCILEYIAMYVQK